MQSLGCRTRWPLGLLLLGTRFPLPELSSVCSSWLGKGSEGVCLGLPKAAASDPPLLLGTSLQHLRRKGRGHREQQACIKSTREGALISELPRGFSGTLWPWVSLSWTAGQGG